MSIKELYICEKSDIGKKIAPVIGKMKGETPVVAKTHITIGDTVVTWFAGHMIESVKPEVYGYTFADTSRAPILIKDDEWIFEPRKDRNGWCESQLNFIKGMATQADIIVNAGDAAREGQYLVDRVLFFWGIDAFGPNVFRFWSKDLEKKTIERSIVERFPNANKRGLFLAAMSRDRADYKWGMSFTSLLTAFARTAGMADGEVISSGRVQSAIMRIMYDREKARREFKPVDFFSPKAKCQAANGAFTARWLFNKDGPGVTDGRLLDRAVVDAMISRCKGKKGTITACETQRKTTDQPLGNDEAGMTIDCAALFEMTSKETAEVGSKLYLDGVMSYPRTDSCYLTEANLETIPEILESLKTIPEFQDMVAKCDLSIRTKTINDSKVEEHNAVIPTIKLTNTVWQELSKNEKNYCYASIIKLLAQFYPVVTYDSTSVSVTCGEDVFSTSGRCMIDLGWRKLMTKKRSDEEDEEDAGSLPALTKGEEVTLSDILPCPDKTKIPPIMTVMSLTALLKSPLSLIKEPELRKLVRETDGIGRPSTREKIQEKLFERNYMSVGKKKTDLLITDLGFDLMSLVPEQLKSIGMTAVWESKLESIAKGELDPSAFSDALDAELIQITKELLDKYEKNGINFKGMRKVIPMKGDGEICPKCGVGHMKTIDIRKDNKHFRFLACDQGREKCGHTISDVQKLPGDGEVCKKCGVGHMKTLEITKDGKKIRFLVCDQDREKCGNIIFPRDFEPLKGEGNICPKCGKGHLITRKFKEKDNPKKTYLALVCDQGKGPDGKYLCDYFKKDIVPLPGDGKVCPKCGKGHMTTLEITKDGRKIRFLVCDQGREKCDNREFVDERKPPKPIAGHGKTCPECKKGKMHTSWQWSNKKKSDLICLRCDNAECGKLEFPKHG